MKHFKAPKRMLGEVDADIAAKLISASADIALVIDSRGIVRDVAFANEDLWEYWKNTWVGKAWIDTVAIDSQSKIKELLEPGEGPSGARWRQVNHPSDGQPNDVPIQYKTVLLGQKGRVVAVGRDLRAMSNLQQRLIAAQQSMEREYQRLRHAETRYRLLFQIASEPVLVVDQKSLKISEANPAAAAFFGVRGSELVGRPMAEFFAAKSRRAVQIMLAEVGASGKADAVSVELIGTTSTAKVRASLFRQDSSAHYLVRFNAAGVDGQSQVASDGQSNVLRVIEAAPEAFVVTGLDGRILHTNAAFLDLAQHPRAEALRGEPLDRFLGRPGVDFNVLMANLRERESVRFFASQVRGEYGSTADVEISAVSVPHGEPPCYGFMMRNIGGRLSPEVPSSRTVPRSAEQMTELVGRVPLKDLVRDTTDIIERLCIEAALQLTDDNRASAAEMLGLSRQSLYVKLRRYGLGDVGQSADKNQ